MPRERKPNHTRPWASATGTGCCSCLRSFASDSADERASGFFGEFIQQLPGFSDFEPFALEINMTCGLTRFMSDPRCFRRWRR